MSILNTQDILIRLALGFLVGMQRERNARPAGIRTHMLVALGSCVVMLTSIQLCCEAFEAFGTLPEPERMGA